MSGVEESKSSLEEPKVDVKSELCGNKCNKFYVDEDEKKNCNEKRTIFRFFYYL